MDSNSNDIEWVSLRNIWDDKRNNVLSLIGIRGNRDVVLKAADLFPSLEGVHVVRTVNRILTGGSAGVSLCVAKGGFGLLVIYGKGGIFRTRDMPFLVGKTSASVSSRGHFCIIDESNTLRLGVSTSFVNLHLVSRETYNAGQTIEICQEKLDYARETFSCYLEHRGGLPTHVFCFTSSEECPPMRYSVGPDGILHEEGDPGKSGAFFVVLFRGNLFRTFHVGRVAGTNHGGITCIEGIVAHKDYEPPEETADGNISLRQFLWKGRATFDVPYVKPSPFI